MKFKLTKKNDVQLFGNSAVLFGNSVVLFGNRKNLNIFFRTATTVTVHYQSLSLGTPQLSDLPLIPELGPPSSG